MDMHMSHIHFRKPGLALAVSFMLMTGLASAQNNQSQEKELTGRLQVEQLLDVKGWFDADFVSYEPSKYFCDKIMEQLGSTSIVCVLGVWCDDCKREVPRFIKVLQAVNFDPKRLTLIGVDRQKVSPGGEQAQYTIDRIPTIIFLKDGRELGRIVEKPVRSLEQDMLAFLEGRDPAAKVEPVDDGNMFHQVDTTDGNGAVKGEVTPDQAKQPK
jgi:thiol-disulfide isomerase/thioredoxin